MTLGLVSLPAEVLLEILKHLSHGDLNRMTRVCRRLYALGTLPSLWRHFNLKVKFKKKESHRVLFIAQTLKKVTGIYRLSSFYHQNNKKSICWQISIDWFKKWYILVETFCNVCKTNDTSSSKCRLSYLAHLDLCDNDLSSLCPKLLARIVNTVENCDIGYTDLTSEQVQLFLDKSDFESHEVKYWSRCVPCFLGWMSRLDWKSWTFAETASSPLPQTCWENCWTGNDIIRLPS